jgi:hypothetical protein
MRRGRDRQMTGRGLFRVSALQVSDSVGKFGSAGAVDFF